MRSSANRDLAAEIVRVARAQPSWSSEMIAARVGCHASTVRKHMPGRVRGRRPTAAHTPEQRALAAFRPDTEPHLLADLARGPNPTLRDLTAENTSIPLPALLRLQRDRDDRVRWSALSNPTCPPRLLARLAHHRDRDVRLAVADNTATPASALERLVADSDASVRWSALTNHSCPAEVVGQAAASGGYLAQGAAARHPHCPQRQLELLITHDDLHIWAAAAINEAHRRGDTAGMQQVIDDAITAAIDDGRRTNAAWRRLVSDQVASPDRDFEEEITELVEDWLDPGMLFDDTAYVGLGGELPQTLRRRAVEGFDADVTRAQLANDRV